jgi:hypothetical protein
MSEALASCISPWIQPSGVVATAVGDDVRGDEFILGIVGDVHTLQVVRCNAE